MKVNAFETVQTKSPAKAPDDLKVMLGKPEVFSQVNRVAIEVESIRTLAHKNTPSDNDARSDKKPFITLTLTPQYGTSANEGTKASRTATSTAAHRRAESSPPSTGQILKPQS